MLPGAPDRWRCECGSPSWFAEQRLRDADDPTDAELDRSYGAGFYVEPTGSVAPAAFGTYRERAIIDSDDDVVVPLSGSGLKA